MKKILILGVICLLCSISVFSQSKKKWETTQTLNTIAAYHDFIVKYPAGKYTEEAKLKLAKLEFLEATKQNTVAAFEDFIKKTSNEQLVTDAKSQIDRIRAEEASFTKAKESNNITEITSFISKYPTSVYNKEANQILEKLYFEQSSADGSLIALNNFLKKYPRSQYAGQINQKIPAAELSHALSIGTEDALIDYIKSHNDAQLIKNAISNLKTYQIVDISKTIPWENLKSVYCGSAESGGKKYLCGINFTAFNPRINEISFQSVMAGPLRYYEPDVASLVMFDWTEFDGYCVKSTNLNHQTSDKKSYYTKASVKIDGLLFETNSIVLKKIK